jgi:hypothetical protein
MYNRKNSIAAACGLAALVLTLVLIPRRTEAQFTSPVRVYNTTPQAIPVVTGPGGTPFIYQDHFIIPNGLTGGQGNPTTPSSTHPVMIDQVSWIGAVSTGQSLSATLNCVSAGLQVNYYFQIPRFAPTSNGQDQAIGLLPLRIYCDANSTIFVSAFRSSGTDAGAFNYGQTYALSGYLLQ